MHAAFQEKATYWAAKIPAVLLLSELTLKREFLGLQFNQ